MSTACEGKRAGDVCDAGGGAGNCVPPDGCASGACLECALQSPVDAGTGVALGGGGCSAGGHRLDGQGWSADGFGAGDGARVLGSGLVLVLLAALVLRR